jgi:hypothetical protein
LFCIQGIQLLIDVAIQSGGEEFVNLNLREVLLVYDLSWTELHRSQVILKVGVFCQSNINSLGLLYWSWVLVTSIILNRNELIHLIIIRLEPCIFGLQLLLWFKQVVDPGCGLGVGNELVDEGEVNNGGT